MMSGVVCVSNDDAGAAHKARLLWGQEGDSDAPAAATGRRSSESATVVPLASHMEPPAEVTEFSSSHLGTKEQCAPVSHLGHAH